MRVGNGPKIDFKCCEGMRHFVNATVERAYNLGSATAVISRAQRLWNAIRAHGDNGGGSSEFCPRHKFREERLANLRHVARENQIPFGASLGKRRMYTGERSASWENIFDYGITKVSIAANLSDQGDLIDHAAGLGCHVFHEPEPLKREQRFVAAHPRAAPSGQYEPGVFHAEMITLEGLRRFI